MKNVSHRCGVTLLEIVLALSLASLLLVALGGVLSGLVRQQRMIANTSGSNWQSSLDHLFWNDLAQARSIGLDQGVLKLSLPGETQSSVPGSVVVIYQLQPTDKTSNRFVRVSFRSSRLGSSVLQEQTLAWNVRRATFERIDDSGHEQPFPQAPGPTPRAFRYRLEFSDGSPDIKQQILVR